MEYIDLRSDTVTHPTPAMRAAMAEAEVGDDVYGDDPTVNRLEALAAEMLGMEAAVFVPSGTMGNLAAMLAHCQRGDEAILGDRAHQHIYEAGGMSALGGIHPRTVANTESGELPLDAIGAAIRPDDVHQPPTRLICLENTHNLCWGSVLSLDYMRSVRALAERHGLRIHLDGARLFNAAAALGVPASALAAQVDSATFCLSKGLCAPVGSVLCGSATFIVRARRMRKILGGGMRQAGVLAAAGIVALETMVDRLAEDHERARALADDLGEIAGIEVLNPSPATNMVYLSFAPEQWPPETDLERAAQDAGIKIKWRGDGGMRLVTHYWIDDAAVERVVRFFAGYSPS
jgi:threonine aldolase